MTAGNLVIRLGHKVQGTTVILFATTQIADNAPRTVEGVKVVLNRQVEAAFGDGLDHVATWNSAFLASEDLGEAASAFAARRTATFKGR